MSLNRVEAIDRPKPDETEDDLLKLQEKFFRNVQGCGSGGPSLQVIRVDKRKVELDERTTSDSHEEKETTMAEKTTTGKKVKFKLPDEEEAEEERMETDQSEVSSFDDGLKGPALNDSILMDIVECNVDNVKVNAPKLNKGLGSFPKVFRCNPKFFTKTVEEKKKTKGSLFARQFRTVQTDDDQIELAGSAPCIRSEVSSRVIDGTGLDPSKSEVLAREIHKENMEKLSSMTKEEILEEQKRLMTTLDPKLLNFLKSRHRKKGENSDEKQNSGKETFVSNDKLSTSSEDISSSSTKVEVAVEDLPIPPIEVSNYVNMSKVEIEKLAWTTSLPDPKPFDPKTGYPARFDFEGMLLSRDEDIPVHRALHHHGEEPEVAGYTLEELFIYARSSILQQRVLGLTTLARILTKNGEGRYDKCLSAPLVPQLIDSGIVLLLRWALDDNTEGNLAPSVAALHSLVVNTADEICLDRTFSWYRGEEMPYLRPTSDEHDGASSGDSSKEANEKELTDAELVKLDVVKALIRMDILQRFRYVLEVLRPSAPVVVHILEILIRLSRHSLQVANTIARFPRLIPVIVKEFIPIVDSPSSSASSYVRSETEKQLSSCYGIPMHQAIKLIRILVSTGRHLASYFLQSHRIMDSILYYMDIKNNLKTFLGNAEYAQLLIEMYRIWKVFLAYELTDEYIEYYYPLIVLRMHVNERLSMNTNVDLTAFDCNLAAELITVVTVVIENTTGETWVARDLGALQLTIKTCLAKWLWELAHSDEQITYAMLKLVAVTFTALVTSYRVCKQQLSFNVVDLINEINNLFNSSIMPFLESKVFNNLLSLMNSSSFLLSGSRLGTDRDPSQLPSFGCLVWGGHLTSLCADSSPFVFLGHFLQSLCTLRHIHCGLDDRFRSLFLNNDCVIKYLERIGTEAMSNICRGRHWFARYEVNVVCNLLVLSSPRPLHPRLFHKAAMAVMPWMQKGDEKIVSKLLSTVIFNTEFISEHHEIEAAIRELSLNERNSIEMPTFTSDRNELLRQTFANLPSICTTYKMYLIPSSSSCDIRQLRESLSVYYEPGSIVSDDFEFLPIVTLSSKTTKGVGREENLDLSCTTGGDVTAETSRTTVVHCLQWCHLLGCLRGDVFGRGKARVRFCHFATVFLIDNDIFLDPTVHRYLTDVVQLMSRRKDFLRLQLESQSDSQATTSFNDFYKQLLTQFEAVSYGDHLFGIFVMTPMQMRYPIHFRRTVWTEHVNALRALGVSFRELPVPLDEFLIPNEEDVNLLGCYFSALINGFVRPNWCPVLYLVAVHHVHNFLFGGREYCAEANGPATEMLKRIRSFETSVVYEHVVHYKCFNSAAALGFDLDRD